MVFVAFCDLTLTIAVPRHDFAVDHSEDVETTLHRQVSPSGVYYNRFWRERGTFDRALSPVDPF